MSYLRARKYKKLFKEFENLTFEYWEKLPKQTQTYGMGKFEYEENDESFVVRAKIAELLPYMEEAAQWLGGNYYIVRSYPAPAIGGPILPVNVFKSVIDPQIGYIILDRKRIVDNINISISLAEKKRREELIRMLFPWNWFIDLCVFIIRIPFVILRKAGLPPKVEENIISHGIKVLATIALLSWLTYKGISLTDIDITGLIKNVFK